MSKSEQPKEIKTPEEILKPYIETPFRHTKIVEVDNALKAIREYASQFETPLKFPDNEEGWNVASLFGYNDQDVCNLLNEYEAKLKEEKDILKRLVEHNKRSKITDTEDWHRGRRGDNFASDKLLEIIWDAQHLITPQL